MSGVGQDIGPMDHGRNVVLAALGLAAVVLLTGLATVPQYGITSDEPVAFYGAEWQLWAQTSSHPDRWKFNQNAPSEFASQTIFNTHPDPTALRLPAFPALVGAMIAPLAKHLPGYETIDSFHAGLTVLHALVVFALVLYLARLLGLTRALVIAFAYAAYPTVVGHSHYNIKDLPMAGFYALAVLSFAAGVIEDRARFIVQSAFWCGLSFSCKGNALFVAPTVLLWMPIAALVFYRRGRLPSRLSVAALCLMPEIAFLTLYLSWPYLHQGSVVEQGRKIGEMLDVMARNTATGRASFSAFPFLAVAGMSPVIVLVGAFLSVVVLFVRRGRDRALVLLGLIWIAIPLTRLAWPHSNYYDGNRLFIEYVPALAMLSGIGLVFGFDVLNRMVPARLRWSRSMTWASLAVLVGALLWPVLQYHPYESLYFNRIFGGLGGAQASRPLTRWCEQMEFFCPDSETDYWAFSYRNAVRDLNAVAEKGSTIYPCGNLIGPLNRWQPYRPDLRIASREEATYFLLVPRRPFCSEDDQRYAREKGTLVGEARRGGGLVYAVYRRN